MRVQRRHEQVVDWLTRDGETIVLSRRRVLRLSPLSAAIFELTQERVGMAALATELEARFGVPVEGTTLDATKDAVMDLVRHGVLRRSE